MMTSTEALLYTVIISYDTQMNRGWLAVDRHATTHTNTHAQGPSRPHGVAINTREECRPRLDSG